VYTLIKYFLTSEDNLQGPVTGLNCILMLYKVKISQIRMKSTEVYGTTGKELKFW
jgi:hypothetical protein